MQVTFSCFDFGFFLFFFFSEVVLGDILLRPNLVLCFVFKVFQTGYMTWFLRLDLCFFGTLKPHCLFYHFFLFTLFISLHEYSTGSAFGIW